MRDILKGKETRAAVLHLSRLAAVHDFTAGAVAIDEAQQQRDRERMEAERRGAALRFEAARK